MLKQYIDNLEAGKFEGVRCNGCGEVVFPPAKACPECGGRDVSPVQLSGKGKLNTFTVCRVAPEGMTPPYIVAMAQLDEGPVVIGNLVGLDVDAADMGLIGRPIRLGSQEANYQAYAVDKCRVLTFELT